MAEENKIEGGSTVDGQVIQIGDVYQRHGIEAIPGTEILVNDEGEALAFAHGGAHHDIVLVPQPKNDIHDPLNWSRTWKLITLANMSFYMFLGNFSTLSIAPLTPLLMEQFDTTLSKVSNLTGACVLILGFGNFVIVPFTNIFGRRPTALICSLIAFAAHLWQGFSPSYGSLLAARVVVGFGASTSETMMPIVVSDMMFLHERGTWMGVYFWSFFMGAWIGPIVSGNISKASWRWFFWLSAILQGVSFLLLLISFPETKYSRKEVDVLNEPTDTDGTPEELSKRDASTAERIEHNLVGKGYPSRSQRWKLWAKPDHDAIRILPRDIITPVYIVVYPIILFASLAVMLGAGSLLVLNLTESQAFGGPPYNFTPSQVGFTNFALLVGGMIGLLTAGPSSDWISMVLTRRNGGIREAEMRLPAFIPFIAIAVIGMTITAVGFQRQWPWEVVVVVGFGFAGVIVMALPTIALTYAVDGYKPIAGQILVTVTIFKNVFGYGMTYFVIDWSEASGFLPPIVTIGLSAVGVSLLGGIIFYLFGKTFRRWTKNSKVHQF